MPETDAHARTTGSAPPASLRGGGATVTIFDATGRLTREALAMLDRDGRRAIDHLGLAGECRVRIAGDAEVAGAHMKHLGQAGTTDIITFDLSDPSKAEAPLFLDVDLLVCLDEAERQARAAGIPVERELLLYIVHGILHCLGHDDHDEREAEAMHAREDQILTAIGVGPVYHRPGNAHGGAAA